MIRPVNDFRIGNLVLNEDGELCKIEQLSSEKMECFQQVSNIENKSCISTKYPSNIYAIELTEEWLLKAGFKKDKYRMSDLVYFENGDITIDLNPDGIFKLHIGTVFIKNIHLVHKLQNFYFEYEGSELVFSTEL